MTDRPQYGDRPFHSGTLSTFTFKRYANMTDADADVRNTGFAYVTSVGALFYNVNGVWVSVAVGSPGVGLIAGGATGQALLKNSGADFDTVWADVLKPSQLGVANGVASLDSTGRLPPAQLPPLAITDTFVVSSQAAMLALAAHTGDMAVRTDISETFILQGSDPTILANWVAILSPSGGVTSWNGRSGAVTPAVDDYLTSQIKPLSTTLGYDGSGRLSTITTAHGTKTLAYDGAGRLSTITGTGDYHSKTFTYDGNGRLSAITVS